MAYNVLNGWPPTYSSCSSCTLGSGTQPTVVSFDGAKTDAFGRLRVSNPHTLFESLQRFSLGTSFVSNTASGGTVSFIAAQSSANLTVTNTIGSFTGRETQYVFTYQPGKSLLIFMTFVMNSISSENLRQRVGYFGSDNGIYLELSDQLYFVKRTNVTGTVDSTTFMVPQSQWNVDPMNGNGSSGITLDITKTQIFWTDIEWLGVGSVRCGFVINGALYIAHKFNHANFSNTVYMTTACLPLRYEIQSLTSSGPATSNLTEICCTVISEGGSDPPKRLYSNVYNFSRTMTAGTWYPSISIKLSPNRLESICMIKQIELVMTTADVIHWVLWGNVEATNLTSANFVADTRSVNVLIDMSATAMTTTGCEQIASGMIAGTNQANGPTHFELDNYLSQIGRDSFSRTSKIFTIGLYSVAGSSNQVGAQILLSWNELLT